MVEEGRENAFMYDNQRCPKAKGKRRRGLWFVSRSYLTWSPSSLTSLWSAAGGQERRESPLGKAGGAHVCDQGATVPTLSVQRYQSPAAPLGDGGVGHSSKVSRKQILRRPPVERVRTRPLRFCGSRNGPTDAG